MKRLWLAAGLLAALLVFTLALSRYTDRLTGELTGLLTQASHRARAGDWEGALALTEEAGALWEGQTPALHIFFAHRDTDQVSIGLREAEEFLSFRESGEYAAAVARLTAQLRLLAEMERLTAENLL